MAADFDFFDPAFQKDVHTNFALVTGAIHEFASAIGGLEKHCLSTRLSGEPLDAFNSLVELKDRWTQQKELKWLRNQLGFHVFGDKIRRGVRFLIANNESLDLFVAGGTANRDCWHPLAHAAVLAAMRDQNVDEDAGDGWDEFVCLLIPGIGNPVIAAIAAEIGRGIVVHRSVGP